MVMSTVRSAIGQVMRLLSKGLPSVLSVGTALMRSQMRVRTKKRKH
jgi:hypothetical protein